MLVAMVLHRPFFFLWHGRCRSKARFWNWCKQIKRINETQWFHDKKEVAIRKQNAEQKKQAAKRQTTRKSPSQICVSPQEAKANNKKNGVRAQRQPTPNDCHTTQREFSTVSQKHAENKLIMYIHQRHRRHSETSINAQIAVLMRNIWQSIHCGSALSESPHMCFC